MIQKITHKLFQSFARALIKRTRKKGETFTTPEFQETVQAYFGVVPPASFCSWFLYEMGCHEEEDYLWVYYGD